MGTWPKPPWWGWADLAFYFRPDQAGVREKRVLFRLLTSESNVTRKRCIDLLLSPEILNSSKSVSSADFGETSIERFLPSKYLPMCKRMVRKWIA